MFVRVFEGGRWSDSRLLGDYAFQALPMAGHKLVLATDRGWATGKVIDIVHRVTDPENEADLALLLTPMIGSDDQSELPAAQLDQIDGASAAVPAPVSRPSPWR